MSHHSYSRARLTFSAAGALLALAAPAAPASAAPASARPLVSVAVITEFATPNLEPLNIAVLPGGTPYFTATAEGSLPAGQLRLGKITSSGRVRSYHKGIFQPAQAGQSQLGGITVGPDGNLWFTQEGGTSSQGEGVIYRSTPAGAVSHQRGVGILSDPASITSGPAGELWFTENSDQVGSETVHGVVGNPISTGNGSQNLPGSIASLDGDLWVTEANTGQIAQVTPSGAVTQYQVTNPGTEPGPTSITVGPGADPDLFYVAGDTIGRISSTGQDRATFSLAGLGFDGSPGQIVAGPDGNLWFTVPGAAQLGQISQNGLATPVTTGITGATGQGIGANKSEVWFTQPASQRVGEVTFR